MGVVFKETGMSAEELIKKTLGVEEEVKMAQKRQDRCRKDFIDVTINGRPERAYHLYCKNHSGEWVKM